MKKVSKVLTLSKYYFGQHSINRDSPGSVSFLQSLTPIGELLDELVYEKGATIGSDVTVTIEVKSKNKCKKSRSTSKLG